MSADDSSGSVTPSEVDSDVLAAASNDRERETAKELKALDSYVKSLPYGCESTEEMQVKLKLIVERIYACILTNSWTPSVGWDHMLQYWLIMRYPLQRETRAALVKLYHQLVISPGAEPRVLRGWADMLGRLIPHKSGTRPKLLPSELQLDWKPLWFILQKRVWASASDADDSLRNDTATFLTVAGLSSPYFPTSEIPAMLDAILPRYDLSSATTVITLVTAFMPPYQSHLYLPILFKIWESINSANIDARIIEVSAALARESLNKFGPVDGNQVSWKDVGLFEEDQWARICRTCLIAMNVPVGPHTTSTVSSTGTTADSYQTNKLTKSGPGVLSTLPTIFAYSIMLDGPIATPESRSDGTSFIAGSKALTSLRTLITSVETYFHPSNHGSWTVNLTTFITHVASEFATRWHEEHQADCKIPVERRLTKEMKRELVETLKTPALLAMFSKDPISTAYAGSALKYLGAMEPALIMPAILERAYNGLESVNETHRVVAVLSCLAVTAPNMLSEKLWIGGQKHLMPLLELTLPGIDINDPTKICALAFIGAALADVKIGDMTRTPRLPPDTDDTMIVDSTADYTLPDGSEELDPPLDIEEERTLTRDSSAAFPDWVVSFIRRILAIFESLPEEGGKSNKTGGKLEESLLKTIRSAVDAIVQHLSDELFDTILKIVYEYATTTVRANSVKAFGTLVSSLAKSQSAKVVDKFLPYCAEQIRIELEHGASSVRTTSVGLALPSDTSLHWHMAVVRGACAGDGAALIPHRGLLLKLLKDLVAGTKNERGFSGTGRLVGRVLAAFTSIYPRDQRFLNPSEWNDQRYASKHSQQWGKLYRVEEVEINWHVPSDDEISFAMQILDEVVGPNLGILESLLKTAGKDRDNVWRNDFTRALHVVRSAWGGLNTIIQLPSDELEDRYLDLQTELPEFAALSIRMNAGFCLTSPKDPRYAVVLRHRERFGAFLHSAAQSLSAKTVDAGDDHIDAILAVIRAVDTFLLDYAFTRNNYASSKKTYEITRDLVSTNSKQKAFPRSIWVKRAQVYHSSRVHTHSLYRRRNSLEEALITDLLEFSVSSYTRARKNAQAALIEAVSYFARSARLVIDWVLQTLDAQNKLGKQADPDKQKGALHLLWNGSVASYTMITPRFVLPYYQALFSLRTQEKPSIQKLVGSAVEDSIGHITAEAMDTSKWTFLPTKSANQSLAELETTSGPFDQSLLKRLQGIISARETLKNKAFDDLRTFALQAAQDENLHWKYQHRALILLVQLIRRDTPSSPDVANVFVRYIVSDHPSLRHAAQRGLVRVLRGVKARSLSADAPSLWLNSRQHPLRSSAKFASFDDFLAKTQEPVGSKSDLVMFDILPWGPLIWQGTVQGYKLPPATSSAFTWEPASKATLQRISGGLDEAWFSKLLTLWAQEGDRSSSSTDLRLDNIFVIKQIVKTFEGQHLDQICATIDSALLDADKFKQRAAAEILAGLIRGSKHFPLATSKKLWDWFSARLPEIYAKATLDNMSIWQSFISCTCADRDPRRIKPMIDFITSIPNDFNSPSVFSLVKSMDWSLTLIESLGPRLPSQSKKLMDLYFQHLGTSYAEIRSGIISTFQAVMGDEWWPGYQNSTALLESCNTSKDPLLVRDTRHQARIMDVVGQLPKLRAERLPGANVSQSLYDKIGLTLLTWIWTVAHSPRAPSVFVYAQPFLPEVLRMSELQDSSEVQQYSSGVLYIMASINPPQELIEPFTESFIESVRSSSSWRIRHKAIPVLAVWYFRHTPSISIPVVRRILDALVECLADENVEVRETAAGTLSGILRSRAEKETVITLKDRFARIAYRTKLPKRDDPKYADTLRKLHSAVLGMIATLQAYPYVVEPWMPALIERLARHASDPQPVSSAVRKFAADFKKTHQDTWHVDKELFNEDQSQALQTIVAGTSYYA